MNDLLESYRVINESYSRKLVFRLGIEAGFFSEYNNMILAMLYCLKHKIRFSLYSENAWFSAAGWSDFFESFCKEEKARVHLTINTRQSPPHPGKKMRFLAAWSKLVYGIDHFTWELWKEFHDRALEQETFVMPELGINGNLRDACHVLTDITWRYNPETNNSVKQLIQSTRLPDQYIGFHIRRGDKVIEESLRPVSQYFEEMAVRSVCRNAFIATDDYQVIETIRQDYPEWTLYTLCLPSDRGYHQKEFMEQDSLTIRSQYLRLFASTDILQRAELFMGTFSSNIGMYLGMRMKPEKCLGINGSTWRLW